MAVSWRKTENNRAKRGGQAAGHGVAAMIGRGQNLETVACTKADSSCDALIGSGQNLAHVAAIHAWRWGDLRLSQPGRNRSARQAKP